MKRHSFIIFIAVLFCMSCSFSKGVKKDLKTGLSYSYNGLKLGKFEVLDSYQIPLSSNKLPEGSVLYFIINDIGNYTITDGKVNIGCSLKVVDVDGNILFNVDDLYKDKENMDAVEARNLIVSVRLSNPITAGKEYNVQMHLYDKKNEKNTINAEIKIDLIPSLVKIDHTEKGLSFDDIWFAEKKGELPENKIKLGSTGAIFLKGLKGFTEESGKVSPGCRLLVTDKHGNSMLKYDDLFKDQNNLSPDVILDGFYSSIKFDQPIIAGASYDVDMYVFDKKDSEKNIQINMTIEVIK